MTIDSRRDEPAVAAPDGETLYGLIAGVARRASDTTLAFACGAGILGAGAVAVFRPTVWPVALPLVCVAAFGAWGIAEREREAAGVRGAALAVVRVLAAAVGTGAALLLAGVVMAKVIGTWIS